MAFAPPEGGRHEGLGTHNRIVPLGGGYLEILAVADAGEAASVGSSGGRWRRALRRAAEGLMGWAVAVDDVVPVAERLGTPVSTDRAPGAQRPTYRCLGGDGHPVPAVFYRARHGKSRIPVPQAVPAVSNGSRWPAILTGSMLGWARRSCQFAWSRVRPRSARWRSAVGSSASGGGGGASSWLFLGAVGVLGRSKRPSVRQPTADGRVQLAVEFGHARAHPPRETSAS